MKRWAGNRLWRPRAGREMAWLAAAALTLGRAGTETHTLQATDPEWTLGSSRGLGFLEDRGTLSNPGRVSPLETLGVPESCPTELSLLPWISPQGRAGGSQQPLAPHPTPVGKEASFERGQMERQIPSSYLWEGSGIYEVHPQMF